ncbi:TOBE domain-containing protein, partial [uncultured Methylobacterium sp.]
PATVSVAEITGSESYVHVDAGESRLIALVAGVRRLEPGTAVTAYLDPRHALVFDESGRTAAFDLPAAA